MCVELGICARKHILEKEGKWVRVGAAGPFGWANGQLGRVGGLAGWFIVSPG